MNLSSKADLARYVRAVIGASAVVALVATLAAFIGNHARTFSMIVLFGTGEPESYGYVLIEVVAMAGWALFTTLFAGLAVGAALQVADIAGWFARHRVIWSVILYALFLPIAAYPAYAIVLGVGDFFLAEFYGENTIVTLSYRVWDWSLGLYLYLLNPVAVVTFGILFRLMLGSTKSLPYPFQRKNTGEPS